MGNYFFLDAHFSDPFIKLFAIALLIDPCCLYWSPETSKAVEYKMVKSSFEFTLIGGLLAI